MGRDDRYFFARRNGTVHIFFHDGTGRYIFFSTTGRDSTTCICFQRDGTVRIFFTAQKSALQEHNSVEINTLYAVLCHLTISDFNTSNCLDTKYIPGTSKYTIL